VTNSRAYLTAYTVKLFTTNIMNMTSR